jgi:hypothetical protein
MNPILFLTIVGALAALSLVAGCSSGGDPRRIASYPSASLPGQTRSPGEYPPDPLPQQLVYFATLALRTRDPVGAAGEAEGLAARYGGYLAASHSWVQSPSRVESVSVTLAVPVYNFDGLRGDLLRLGDLEDERVWGERTGYSASGYPLYSRISVEFRPREADRRGFHLGSWDPGRTFARAMRVSIAIFGFLADILIWVLVVLVPLVLLAWLVVGLVRQIARRTARRTARRY